MGRGSEGSPNYAPLYYTACGGRKDGREISLSLSFVFVRSLMPPHEPPPRPPSPQMHLRELT